MARTDSGAVHQKAPTPFLTTHFALPCVPDGGAMEAALRESIAERKRVEAALRASEERQAFLLKVSDALRPLSDPSEIQGVVAHLMAMHFGVSRANYAEVEEHSGIAYYVVRQAYTAPGLPSLVGRHPVNLFDGTFQRLGRGETVVIHDIANEVTLGAEERTALLDIQVAAGITVPLVKGGRLVAVFPVHHDEPRVWSPGEVDLVEEIAERTWAAVERARAEGALRQQTAQTETLLYHAPFGIYFIDADMRIRHVNPVAAPVFAGVPNVVGRDFAEVIHILWPMPFAEEVVNRFRHTLETGESVRRPRVHRAARGHGCHRVLHMAHRPRAAAGG